MFLLNFAAPVVKIRISSLVISQSGFLQELIFCKHNGQFEALASQFDLFSRGFPDLDRISNFGNLICVIPKCSEFARIVTDILTEWRIMFAIWRKPVGIIKMKSLSTTFGCDDIVALIVIICTKRTEDGVIDT